MELSAIPLLLIKLDTNDGANYDINRNTVCLILQDSGLCSIFSITFIKHSKVMSNLGLFPQVLYYTLDWKFNCSGDNVWNISLVFYHWVIFKAILCCLSFPPSIGNPTLSLSQVSIMGVLLLIPLGETQPFYVQNPTVAKVHSYIPSQFFKQDYNSFALSKCPCYHNPHNLSLVKKDDFIPSPWAWLKMNLQFDCYYF